MQRAAILAVLLTWAAVSATADEIRISLKPQVELSSGRIQVADVADVKWDNERQLAALREIELGATPLPGNTRAVTRENIVLHLIRNGISPNDVKWDGALFCRATTKAVVVTPRQIIAAGEAYLRSLPIFKRDGVTMTPEREPPEKQLPTLGTPPELKASATTVETPWGRVTVFVRIINGGQLAATVPMVFRVTCQTPVVYAAKALRRGEIINKDDLTTREILMGPGSAATNVVTRKESAIGKKAARDIPSGTPLSLAMINDPLAVRKGESVAIHLTTKNLEVVTKGTCLADGHVGDVIPVKVHLSGRETTGRVTEAGRVDLTL